MFFHDIFAALVHLGGEKSHLSLQDRDLWMFFFFLGIVNMDAA